MKWQTVWGGDTKMEQTRERPAYRLAACGVMAAVLCVLGPLSIPIGPVPVTLATLVVYLMAYLLGWKWGTVSCLVYLMVGMAGLPVFSGYRAGTGALLGPTGGYLIGYLPMALLSGWVMERTDKRVLHLLGMILGTAFCYLLGTAWFCWQGGYTVGAAMGLCVLPFIPFDLVKMLVVLAVGPVVRRRMKAARLLA